MKVFNNVYTRFACALILSVGLFAYASCSGAGGGSNSGALSAADSVSTINLFADNTWEDSMAVPGGTQTRTFVFTGDKVTYTLSNPSSSYGPVDASYSLSDISADGTTGKMTSDIFATMGTTEVTYKFNSTTPTSVELSYPMGGGTGILLLTKK